jgi:hypothetical protein
MTFAKRVFFCSGIYGILVLFPLYFLERRLGVEFPPATNHPEQFYAFIGVGLAWQFAFLLIASDVRRFRPLMLPAMAEKFLAGGAVLWLFAIGRIDAMTLGPFIVDLVLGVLFVVSYRLSSERAAR